MVMREINKTGKGDKRIGLKCKGLTFLGDHKKLQHRTAKCTNSVPECRKEAERKLAKKGTVCKYCGSVTAV